MPTDMKKSKAKVLIRMRAALEQQHSLSMINSSERLPQYSRPGAKPPRV